MHDLRLASALYQRLADDYGDAQYEALAHTARGGMIEARVATGEVAGADAIDLILAELDRFVDLEAEQDKASAQRFAFDDRDLKAILLAAPTPSL